MTLRIERVQGGIRLSGEFRVGQLDQVKTEIELCPSPVILDLEELDLIDLEGVRFLNACEAKGISILRCSPSAANPESVTTRTPTGKRL
jgi:hypothetical protein